MANQRRPLPRHIAYQVEHGGCPMDEALATAVTEALEGPDGALDALEWLRELAELQNPKIKITVLTQTL